MSSIESCQKVLDDKETGLTVLSILKEADRSYRTSVEVVCKQGHISKKNVSSLVRSGCLECQGKKSSSKLSEEDIFYKLKAKRLYPIKLGNSTKEPATLRCMKCFHTFDLKILHKALHSTGCPKCAGNVRMEMWELAEACAKKGWCMNWVEYDEDKYTMSYMHGRCQKCGNKHSGTNLKKYVEGFAKCGHCEPRVTGFKSTEPATLYYLLIQDDYKVYYKIGITNRTVQDRFSKDDLEKITVLSELHYEEGWKALKLEQYFLQTSSEYRYQGSPILASGGNTELFVKDVLELDSQPSP